MTSLTTPNSRIVCNGIEPEAFPLEAREGRYIIRGSNGKLWRVHSEGHAFCDGVQQTQFFIRLENAHHISLKPEGGQYFKTESSGNFLAQSATPGPSELLEF